MTFHAMADKEITPELTQELLIFLKCWFLVHMTSCDRAYDPHLRAKRIT